MLIIIFEVVWSWNRWLKHYFSLTKNTGLYHTAFTNPAVSSITSTSVF